MSRSISRSISSGVTRTPSGIIIPGGGGGEAFDYAAAVVDAGGTLEAGDAAVIDTFNALRLGNSWGEKLIWLNLPVWGLPAPNAIDMVTGVSGTYVGTLTYAASGTWSNNNGYFMTGVDPVVAGMTLVGGGMGVLVWIDSTGSIPGGVHDGTNEIKLVDFSGIKFDYTNPNSGDGRISVSAPHTGILSGSVEGSTQRVRRYGQAGLTHEASRATSGLTGVPTGYDVWFHAQNSSGTDIGHHTAAIGACFLTLGTTDAEDAAMAAALKDLWEGITGVAIAA